MVKKLAALELVEHAPYRGVRLTAAGEKVAGEGIRHHRLLELYLADTLGLHVDAVHDEADRLEHVLSEELEAKHDAALGSPTHDPHGDTIPNAKPEWPKSSHRTDGPALAHPVLVSVHAFLAGGAARGVRDPRAPAGPPARRRPRRPVRHQPGAAG